MADFGQKLCDLPFIIRSTNGVTHWDILRLASLGIGNFMLILTLRW
jgi:hypothetical protein